MCIWTWHFVRTSPSDDNLSFYLVLKLISKTRSEASESVRVCECLCGHIDVCASLCTRCVRVWVSVITDSNTFPIQYSGNIAKNWMVTFNKNHVGWRYSPMKSNTQTCRTHAYTTTNAPTHTHARVHISRTNRHTDVSNIMEISKNLKDGLVQHTHTMAIAAHTHTARGARTSTITNSK